MVTMRFATTSSSVRRSPSTSAVMRALTRLAGSCDCLAHGVAEIVGHLLECCAGPPRLGRDCAGNCRASRRSPPTRTSTWRWSSTGRPNISAVTIAGSGLAKSAITSIRRWRRRDRRGRRRSLGCATRGSSTLLGVNAAAAIRRIRPWAGGSRNSICLTMTRAIGTKWSQPERGQLLGRRGAGGDKALEHRRDVGVTGNDPGVQIRVPVDRIFLAQPPVERVRTGEHVRLQEVVQTEGGCRGGHDGQVEFTLVVDDEFAQ